jgi:hypothetical protein
MGASSAGSNGKMHSTWSTLRRIFSTRSARQAQMEGQTKCTVLMPCLRRSASRSRLKSGASTPMNTSGRLRSSRSRSWLRMPQSRGSGATPPHSRARPALRWPPGLETRAGHLRGRRCRPPQRRPAPPAGRRAAARPAGRPRFRRPPWPDARGRRSSASGPAGSADDAALRRAARKDTIICRTSSPPRDGCQPAPHAARACSSVRFSRYSALCMALTPRCARREKPRRRRPRSSWTAPPAGCPWHITKGGTVGKQQRTHGRHAVGADAHELVHHR